jgi:lysophospholipase L1-like esterase
MPTYTFRFAPAAEGLPVTIRNAAGTTVHTGTAGAPESLNGPILYTAELAAGTYTGEAARVPDGYSSRSVGVYDVEAEVLTGRLAESELGATYAARGLDLLVKPAALALPRQPLRLAQPLWANEKPNLFGTNGPLPSSNYRDVPFEVDGTGPFNAWGAVVWDSTGQGLTDYWGSGSSHTNNVGGPWEFEFVTDSLSFAIKMTTGSTALQIMVDDELVYEATNMPSGGSWLQVAWQGTRRLRRYHFRGGNGMAIHSLRLAQADSIFAPDETGLRAAWVGDSYSQNSGRQAVGGLARIATAALGWKRLYLDAQGSTGYAQTTGDGGKTFLQRVPDLVTLDPDVIVFAGGHNTSAAEQASGFQGLYDSAAAVFALVRASLPDVPIFAIGPWSQGTTFETANTAAWDKLEDACAVHDVTFIDTRGWVTGTGKETALANNGNADALVSSDGTHYNNYGAEYVALRTAAAITATL